MPETKATESIRFREIAAASAGDQGTLLYGLTGDGRVYQWRADQKLWISLPMFTPAAEDSHTGFRMMTADEMQMG